MNRKPTFVFKSSQIQTQLVTEIDRDGTGFLNDKRKLVSEQAREI